jgi:hypothetical protein
VVKRASFSGGDAEGGVVHAEGVDEALLKNRFERLAACAGHEDAEDVGAGVVHPHFAGLVHERERGEAADPLAGGMGRVGFGADEDAVAGHGLEDGIAAGRAGEEFIGEAEAEAEGEQVAEGDGAAGGDGVVEAELALLDQSHGGGGEGLSRMMKK